MAPFVLTAIGAVDWRRQPPSPASLFWFVLLGPLIEEILFRGGLQEWLLRWRMPALGPLSLANALASLAFVLLHGLSHPPIWALATLLPALLFGWFYERGRALWRPVCLHMVYNAVLFGALTSS